MALKFKLKSKDEIPAEFQSLYVERDGAFVLDAEGAVEKSKLDEFRADNVALLKQLDDLKKRFEGIGPEAVAGGGKYDGEAGWEEEKLCVSFVVTQGGSRSSFAPGYCRVVPLGLLGGERRKILAIVTQGFVRSPHGENSPNDSRIEPVNQIMKRLALTPAKNGFCLRRDSVRSPRERESRWQRACGSHIYKSKSSGVVKVT